MIAKKLWTDLQKELQSQKHAGRKLWWVRIVAGPFAIPGLPDVFICAGGRFVVLELKREEDDTPTPKQAFIMERIREAGGTAGTVRSVVDAVALLTF